MEQLKNNTRCVKLYDDINSNTEQPVKHLTDTILSDPGSGNDYDYDNDHDYDYVYNYAMVSHETRVRVHAPVS